MVLLDGLAHDTVAALLAVDRPEDFEGVEREHPDCLAVVWPADLATGKTISLPLSLAPDAVRELTQHILHGKENRLSRDDPVPWEFLDQVEIASWKSSTEQRAEHMSDGRLLSLIWMFLRQDIVKGVQRWTPNGGTPQGAVISPLLANIYLHPLDCWMRERGYRMVRYADDFVVLCQTAGEARAGLAAVQAWVQANALILNPDKTHVRLSAERPGLRFPGLSLRGGTTLGAAQESESDTRSYPDQDRAHTRGQAAQHRCGTEPHAPGLVRLLQARSSVDLRRHGWLRAAPVAHAARNQQKRPGAGHTLADHHRWPIAFFADMGLFTMTEAHAQASRPR